MNRLFSVTVMATAFTVDLASASMKFATHGTHTLEEAYVEDCLENPNPHGYYGAYFQPCEFSFFQSQTDSEGTGVVSVQPDNACTDPSSTLLAKPVPVHWFFNLTEHFDEMDWDSNAWDEHTDWKQVAQKLFLWPDQCVGVGPRCYALTDATIFQAVQPFFADGIPQGATHVQVDCQADAAMLSRTAYALADGLEKSTPTIIAWMVTVVLLTIVALAWCLYGCARLCCSPEQQLHYDRFRRRRSDSAAPVVVGTGYAYQAVDNNSAETMIYPQKVEKV